MRKLTDKQRGLVLALDTEWRTVDELVERQGTRGLSRGRTENTLLDNLANIIEYRMMGSGPRLGHYRLREPGELLHSEAQKTKHLRDEINYLVNG